MKDKNTDEINREKICPFLVKVYYKENEFNNLDDILTIYLKFEFRFQ